MDGKTEDSRDSELNPDWRIRKEDGGRPWMPRFIELLEETVDIKATAKACNIGLTTAYRGRQRCEWFQKEWDRIITTGVLEPARAEIVRRSIWGTPKPVIREVEVLARNDDGTVALDGKGQPIRTKEWQTIGFEIEYETALTKMFAERRLPEYAPQVGATDGKSGVLLVGDRLTVDEFKKLVADSKPADIE